MVNSPQSSRVAGSYNRSLFTNAAVASIPKDSYYAMKTFTQAGENDIQIKKKERANVLHYFAGAAVVVGLVYYAATQLD